MRQRTFADLSWERKEKTTRRERFLGEMSEAIPWKELERLIEPVAPSVVPSEVGGRPAYPVSVMLRVYFCQSWYQLSDDGAEDALYDIESVRRFCTGSTSVDRIPDERSIRRFRHLLEEHELQEELMRRVTRLLSEKGIVTKHGTIVDATLVHAPSSTKNSTSARDPEMSSTKKNNRWHFGMKCHIGVDEESGVVHTVVASTAKDADITYLGALLHGEETVVRGDAAYASEVDRDELEDEGVRLLTPKKTPIGGQLTDKERENNRKLCSKRAVVEHPFRIVKCIFGYRKVRYRGLHKNFLHQLTLFMLANLYKVRHILTSHPQRA